jgi:hypothetical protein
MVLSTSQTPTQTRLDISAAELPAGQVWDEFDETKDGPDGSGGGGSFTGWTTDDGTFSTVTTMPRVDDPISTVRIVSEDGAVACRLKLWPNRQLARTTCRLADRQLRVTALHNDTELDVSSTLQPVKPKSAWNVSASMVTPHSSSGSATSVRAGPAGSARSSTSLDFATNRTLTLKYTGKNGNSCALKLATHRLPAKA